MPARSLAPLLPEPRSATIRDGSFPLRPRPPIVLAPGASPRDFATAVRLRDGVREAYGITLPIEGHRRTDSLGPCLRLVRGDASGREGDAYSLSITPEGVVARGAAESGLRYAVETLCQLAAASRSATLPACEIDDSPDFALRGVMLDVSRGKVPTVATLRGLVDLCVRLKLNVLMLYTEHTFRFRRHPQIGCRDSPLDAEDLRELDAYAALQCVELVPSLQSLGHMEHILGLPAYHDLAETDAGWTLSPQVPGTYALLGDLYDEYLPNFRSGLFNANCDEPWDLGRGKSSDRDAALGPGGVYLSHVERLRELARLHDKRLMIWGDVVHAHPERVPDLPRDLVLLDWWYEAEFDYDRVRVFAENGLEFLVCPGTSSWNCLFPRVENSWRNTAGWADAGRRHGALGLLTTDWGDYGHYNLQGNSWFGYAHAAQQSWSGDVAPERFERAFSRVLFGDETREIARLYRELGAVHDPGFAIFNGSALQFLFFDELERAIFVSACRPAALRRCERSLLRIRDRIARARPRFRRESLTADELAYAADASLLAVRKARAGLAYNAWRRDPSRVDGRERQSLAGTLRELASEQTSLGRRLRRLWLARSAISNFETTRGRIARSARSLRTAATRLEQGRPSAPPPPHTGFSGRDVLAALRASLASVDAQSPSDST